MEYNIGDYVVCKFKNEQGALTFAAGTIVDKKEKVYTVNFGTEESPANKEVPEENIVKKI